MTMSKGRHIHKNEVAPGTRCTRCGDALATTIVKCWYGCAHAQCDRCAPRTTMEAKDGP